MPADTNDQALRKTILTAIRAWTYDEDEETVAALKGENGRSYRAQDSLVDRIAAAVRKRDEAAAPGSSA